MDCSDVLSYFEQGKPPIFDVQKRLPDFVPSEVWVDVWIPMLNQNDVLRDQVVKTDKVGGLPLLNKEEEWPDKRHNFVAQFWDPRPHKQDNFVQIFLPLLADVEINDKALVRTFSKAELQAKKNKMKVAQHQPHSDAMPSTGRIVGWIHTKEFSSEKLDDHFDEEKIDDVEERLVQLGYDRFPGFKIGGIGATCQRIEYRPFASNMFFETWGDSGSLHLNENELLNGDMA